MATDDLAKYEALVNTLTSGATRITLQLSAANAITELAAMVREAQVELREVGYEQLALTKRAEAAELDAKEAAANTDHALHQMMQWKERAEAAERELAELKRSIEGGT